VVFAVLLPHIVVWFVVRLWFVCLSFGTVVSAHRVLPDPISFSFCRKSDSADVWSCHIRIYFHVVTRLFAVPIGCRYFVIVFVRCIPVVLFGITPAIVDVLLVCPASVRCWFVVDVRFGAYWATTPPPFGLLLRLSGCRPLQTPWDAH